MKIPEKARAVIHGLESHGYSVYLVGGCVRDSLLGLEPSDYDFTTNALPEEIIRCFEHTVATGIRHGTVTVVMDHIPFEVTTYRTETNYTDHRHPSRICFVNNITEDLARRDFTINAMAYHPKTGLIDPFGGKDDCENGILRTVGVPQQRFCEDALRILRLFRFACRFGFTIEKATRTAAERLASTLRNISVERVADELFRIIGADFFEPLETFISHAGLSFLGIHTSSGLSGLCDLPNEKAIRFYAFCESCRIHPVKFAEHLKCDRALCHTLQNLGEILPVLSSDRIELKRLLSRYPTEDVRRAFILKRSDASQLDDILAKAEPCHIRDLAIDGNDLISIGLNGKEIGNVLACLLDQVIEKPSLNHREKLLKISRQLRNIP